MAVVFSIYAQLNPAPTNSTRRFEYVPRLEIQSLRSMQGCADLHSESQLIAFFEPNGSEASTNSQRPSG